MDFPEDLSVALREVKNLKEPKTLPELMEQLEIISRAIEKCEKIMQHMAASLSSDSNSAMLLSQYKQLLFAQETLESKREKLASPVPPTENSKTAKRPWYKVW
jgi:DNA repair exonuclease SbcCD ATPase subunit